MFFLLLTAVVQGTIVMGAIEMRKIDFSWLVSSFQGPSPT